MLTKLQQLGISLTKIYWLLGRRSKPSTSNHLPTYKAILKPVWTYGMQLWSTASSYNREILECLQSNSLRTMMDAPWYVPNTVNRRDLQTLSLALVRIEVSKESIVAIIRAGRLNELLLTLFRAR
jgi:hypothetical protein